MRRKTRAFLLILFNVIILSACTQKETDIQSDIPSKSVEGGNLSDDMDQGEAEKEVIKAEQSGYLYESKEGEASILTKQEVCSKPYYKSDVDTLIEEYLDWKYETTVVLEDENYYHIKETKNGNDTGTYAIFVFNGDGTIDSASFYQGSVYDMNDEELIGEERAYEIACEAIHKKYDNPENNIVYEIVTSVSEAGIKKETIKNNVYYTMKICGFQAGSEHEEYNEIWFEPRIDVYSGECVEIASTLMW